MRAYIDSPCLQCKRTVNLLSNESLPSSSPCAGLSASVMTSSHFSTIFSTVLCFRIDSRFCVTQAAYQRALHTLKLGRCGGDLRLQLARHARAFVIVEKLRETRRLREIVSAEKLPAVFEPAERGLRGVCSGEGEIVARCKDYQLFAVAREAEEGFGDLCGAYRLMNGSVLEMGCTYVSAQLHRASPAYSRLRKGEGCEVRVWERSGDVSFLASRAPQGMRRNHSESTVEWPGYRRFRYTSSYYSGDKE